MNFSGRCYCGNIQYQASGDPVIKVQCHCRVELQKKEVEQQKQLVEENQKEIIDSITYARRIQSSLLPSEKYIEKSLIRLKKLV